MQNRDVKDRFSNCVVNVDRIIIINCLNYFLNIKRSNITIDTICSISLIDVNLICRSLHTREINAIIVVTSNFYLNLDHVMNLNIVKQIYLLITLCHTFNVDANDYVKTKIMSYVILKRLFDAI